MRRNGVFLFLIALFTANFLVAQSQSLRKSILRATDVQGLEKLEKENRKRYLEAHEKAVNYARLHGLPVRVKYEDGTVIELQYLGPGGFPVYYVTFNEDAAETVSTDEVWPGGKTGYKLTGSGFTIGEWDEGKVRASHQEFGNRVVQKDNATNLSNHATHVAGTLIAGGMEKGVKGMAYKAGLHAYDWSGVNAELPGALKNGLLISNHSYGELTGWRKNKDSSNIQWQWYGNTQINPYEDYQFGFYSQAAKTWDEIAHKAPYHLIVKAAGNERSHDGPGSGKTHYVFDRNKNQWVKSTTTRKKDGDYDCIPPKGVAKNVLTVGAVEDISGGYSQPSDVKMTGFSSWGPSDDGRIKPDIVANGKSLKSTKSTGNTGYYNSSGTSMAAPNVSGSLILLQEHFGNVMGTDTAMKASTLKALVIHTADEAGNNTGPDYSFGWGLLNTHKAAKTISQMNQGSMLREVSLKNYDTVELKLSANGKDPLVVTLCWNDVPGSPPSPSLDPTTRMLVNDLDLRLIDDSNNVSKPWILNPTKPSFGAGKGNNYRDNVEQVYIARPKAGVYKLRVTHKGGLNKGDAQPFSIVATGLTTQNIIHCRDTGVMTGKYGVFSDGSGDNLYGNNSDCSWLIAPKEKNKIIDLYFPEFNTEAGNDVVNIYDGSSTSAPLIASFSGMGGIHPVSSTGDSLFVQFQSNSSIKAKGWSAYYVARDTLKCQDPEYLNFRAANNANVYIPWLINRRFNSSVSRLKLKEVGYTVTDWIDRSGKTFQPEYPFMLDSFSIRLSHENNSGKNDTFIAYLSDAGQNGYPERNNFLWSDTVIVNKSLSSTGDWRAPGGLTKLTFYPEISLSKPYFAGFIYSGDEKDTASIIAHFNNLGTLGNPKAEEADYGLTYRRYAGFYNERWLPYPDGTEPFKRDNLRDHNQNGQYDAGEAHYMQVAGFRFFISEPYLLSSQKITPSGPTDFCTGEEVKLNGPSGFSKYRWSNGVETRTITVSNQDSFFVRVWDQNNCSALSDTVGVEVYPLPDKPVVYFTGDKLVTDTGYASYQWYRNDTLLPGEISDNLILEKRGKYKVKVTGVKGCEIFSKPYNYSPGGSGISSLDNHLIKIYPNPNEGIFHVEIKGSAFDGVVLSVYGPLGKKVYHKHYKEGHTTRMATVRFSANSSGIYLLEVKGDNKVLRKKIMVAKP